MVNAFSISPFKPCAQPANPTGVVGAIPRLDQRFGFEKLFRRPIRRCITARQLLDVLRPLKPFSHRETKSTILKCSVTPQNDLFKSVGEGGGTCLRICSPRQQMECQHSDVSPCCWDTLGYVSMGCWDPVFHPVPRPLRGV